ncbi:MAG: VCBS repeat-containing protein [Candidatus Latescibacterota bacterium]|nr:MAG: VCBS repeat-containing protein [Candidatus Latescibacterota bacterium]
MQHFTRPLIQALDRHVECLNHEAITAIKGITDGNSSEIANPLTLSNAMRRRISRRSAYYAFVLGDYIEGLRKLADAESQDAESVIDAISCDSSIHDELWSRANSRVPPELLAVDKILLHRDLPQPMRCSLAAMRDEWGRIVDQSSYDSISCVMIADPSGVGALSIGKILRIHATLNKIADASVRRIHDPEIQFNGRIQGDADPFAQQMKRAVLYAEDYFLKTHGVWELQRLPRKYTFHVSGQTSLSSVEHSFTGGSAGLALTLLTMGCIDGFCTRCNTRILREDAVISGAVNSSGAVESISNSGLEEKIRTVFFSPYRYLALPETNIETAETILKTLKLLHPRCSLELISVTSTTNAHEDQKITMAARIGRSRVILAKLGRWRKHAVMASLMFVPTMLAAILLPLMFQHKISGAHLSEGTLSMINPFGRTFKTHALPYQIREKLPQQHPFGQMNSAEHIADVDGDGRREYVFVGIDSRTTRNPFAGRINIHLFSQSGDSLAHISLWNALTLPDKDGDQVYADYMLYHSRLDDFDGDGRKELTLLLRNAGFFPCAIVVLSFKDMRFQTYAHLGHLNNILVDDFDGDGRLDILAAGTNNAYGGSVMAMLDPTDLEGSSPKLPFKDHERDISKMYILIPKSVLVALPEADVTRPEASIDVYGNGTIRISSIEGNRSIFFHFDSAMTCIGVFPTDYWKLLHDQLAPKYGLLPIDRHMQELRDKVRYWDGENWLNTPTVNRSR